MTPAERLRWLAAVQEAGGDRRGRPMTASVAAALATLAASGAGRVWAGSAAIAARAGCAHSTARSALMWLRNHDFLATEHRHRHGTRAYETTMYTLKLPNAAAPAADQSDHPQKLSPSAVAFREWDQNRRKG